MDLCRIYRCAEQPEDRSAQDTSLITVIYIVLRIHLV